MIASARVEIVRDHRLPYYEQLKRLLMAEILDDGLEPGHLMPSESAMCERYDVSRTVVRQAVGELVNEGFLQRMRGKGTFVARAKIPEQFMQTTVGFFEDMAAAGRSVTSSVLSCDIVAATDRIGDLLDLQPDRTCIEMVRLRSVDDEIVAFTKSYINTSDPKIFAFLKDTDLSMASLYRVLEEHFGMRIESGRRWLEATSAPVMLAKLLEIRTGDPLLFIESIGRDGRGNAVEAFQAWHRADRMQVAMDVVRDKRSPALENRLSHDGSSLSLRSSAAR